MPLDQPAPEADVYRINLEHGEPGPATTTAMRAPRVIPQTAPSPDTGMSMDQLRRNYRTTLRAGALYYPVAYKFVRRLGRGRQGVVFLAQRQGARGCVTEHAIKLFDPALYGTPAEYWTDMGRIASQISRLQSVQSPHIVARHTYEETAGIGYVQMDAIDGFDLRWFLTRKHLAVAMARSSPQEWAKFNQILFRLSDDHICLQPGVVVYMLRAVLGGLERLHAAHFLHFDVKPGNVMIDRLGYVKLVDFGRAVISGEELTFLLGSPMYMSPETHRRQPGTPASDLYSVGIMALEMLRGRPLTAATAIDEAELLAAKQNLPSRLPELLPSHVSANEGLVAVLRHLVAPAPEDRYASAREAEIGAGGLAAIDKQLVQAGLAAEYAHVLSDYVAKLVDHRTGRIEKPEESA